MRQALKGVSPSAPDVSAWLWWKSGTKSKPFPAERIRVRAADTPPREEPEAEGLRELEQRLEQAQIQVREAEQRAAAAEQEARAHREAEERLRERMSEIEQKTAEQPSGNGAAPQGPKRNGEKPIALNEASFEQLRELGLSVNQAARLIAQRDQRGGFSSTDELDGLYGMPREIVDTLRRCSLA